MFYVFTIHYTSITVTLNPNYKIMVREQICLSILLKGALYYPPGGWFCRPDNRRDALRAVTGQLAVGTQRYADGNSALFHHSGRTYGDGPQQGFDRIW